MPEGQAPWEKNGESFDAEKAWSLITNLREENSTLRSEKSTLQDRLRNSSSSTKKEKDEASTLRKENMTLRLQMDTGLTEKQVARLVGDTFEDKMKDAEAYAEETGIELRSLIAHDSDPSEDQDVEGGTGGEEPKRFERNYRAPGQIVPAEDPVDYGKIAQLMDV